MSNQTNVTVHVVLRVSSLKALIHCCKVARNDNQTGAFKLPFGCLPKLSTAFEAAQQIEELVLQKLPPNTPHEHALEMGLTRDVADALVWVEMIARTNKYFCAEQAAIAIVMAMLAME